MAGEGFALPGNGISELKFLFLFFGLAEKCFSRKTPQFPFCGTPEGAVGTGGRRWWGCCSRGEAGVGDAGEVWGGEEGGWERAGLLQRGSP